MHTGVKNYPVSAAESMHARMNLLPHVKPTALRRYESLCRLIGTAVYVKHENHNLTGTFKIRGSINLMSHLRKAGVEAVITYSTGNHGTSVAASARLFGLKAVIVLPENSNPLKVQSIRDTGAELIEWGDNFDEAEKRSKSW